MADKIKWIDKKREKPDKPEFLPKSSDYFFQDAEIHHVDKNALQPTSMGPHKIKQIGPMVVCVGCPFTHTIAVDTSKYEVRQGHIVPKT